MAPVRVKVEDIGDGWHRVSVGCPCARLGRNVPTWENVAEVIAELREQHQREARVCPHP